MSWIDNGAFSRKIPKLQLFWDSVSTGALKKCPRYYELSIVEGWQPKGKRTDLEFGLFLHSGRERYYHARARGENHEVATNAALDYVLTATWDNVLDRPWMSGDSSKNRYTLAQAMVDYCDKWEHDPLATVILASKLPAVEMSFRFPLGFGPTGSLPYDAQSDSGGESAEEFWLCGHLDRAAEFQERTWISDLKSTRSELNDRYFKQFKVNNQFSLYALAGRIVLNIKAVPGIIVDAVQVLATQPPRFKRVLVERTEAQLTEFVRGLHVLLRQAEYYARHGFWPMNERACFEHGRPCDFLEICGRAPSVREQWLRADFVKRTWDPTKVRGDI
jgi:hypothetical protein